MLVLILPFVIIAVIIGLIAGVIKLLTIPHPPPGSSRADIQWWYTGGWKEAKELEEQFSPDVPRGPTLLRPKRVKTKRKGMHILAIICYAYAVIYTTLAIKDNDIEMIGISLSLVVWGIMFSVLKRTPRGSYYIFDAPSGIKPGLFVFLCMVVAIAMPVIFFSTQGA